MADIEFGCVLVQQRHGDVRGVVGEGVEESVEVRRRNVLLGGPLADFVDGPTTVVLGLDGHRLGRAESWLVDHTPAEDLPLLPVANTLRLPLPGPSHDGGDVPRRLVDLAERARLSPYGCLRPSRDDLLPTHPDLEAENCDLYQGGIRSASDSRH